MVYSKTTLRQTAKALDFTGGFFENDDPAFVWVIAGSGEIQVSEDGAGWWLRWDRTHAVADEAELSPPEVTDGEILAEWMVQEARRFQDR